jgi:putative transposase
VPIIAALSVTVLASFRSRMALQIEILALRHQLGVLQRSVKRPKLTPTDRMLWAWLSAVWKEWRSGIFIIKAATVIGWHRKGFRLFWTWKIRRGKPGRPRVPFEIRELIRTMSRENPIWGAPRIHGELLKLGIDIGETSVSKYMIHGRRPPSQTWRTFRENHIKSLVSVDFFTVPTLRFQVLYVFLMLAHDRRRILHFAVTAHPTAEWTIQQLREAFTWDTAPRYLLRDRDRIFGRDFVDQVKAMGIKEVVSAPRSPRVFGPCYRMQRTKPLPVSSRFRPLLSSNQDAPGIAEGHARISAHSVRASRASHFHSGGRRTPSSLRAMRRLNLLSPQVFALPVSN